MEIAAAVITFETRWLERLLHAHGHLEENSSANVIAVMKDA